MDKRTRTLVLLGVLIGFVATAAIAVQFAPGDASKVSDGVTFKAPNDGVEVKLWGETNVSLDDAFPNSSTHSSQFADRSVMLNTSSGNITLASDSSATAHIHTSNLTGPWTNLTSITAGGTWIETYPENKQRVDVRGDANELSIANATLDDGDADLYYSGPDSGTVSVIIYDLPANTQIAAADADTGSYLDHATSDNNGNLSLNLPSSSHSVELLNADTTNTPTYDNATPQGLISSTPNELSVDVSDGDFPTDDVEVNISLDGSHIHSENITSNSTVSTSNYGNLDLGTHNWTVNSTDAYNNFQSAEYQFSLPSNITLRNETNASQIITDQNITATFYSANGQIVVQRSDSNQDGNISLRGLPDTEFVVTFSGSGWHDRRAYIESIGNQQNIYLLNSTAYPTGDDSAIETTFVFEDRTNQFDQDETTLRIQRAVDPNNDGNFSWQNVAGDYWGAAGEFPFTGEYQQRYRLRIKNQETGDERILGTHIPKSDGVKNLVIGDIIFDAENATGLWYNADINENTSNLQIYYQDPTNETGDLTVTVYEQGNSSNEIYNTTHQGPNGEISARVALTSEQTNNNWIVEFDGEHTTRGSVFGQIIVGGASYPLPMDPLLLAAFGYAAITFIMALYGPRVSIMGAWAGVMVFGGLMVLGWLEWSIAALTIAFLAAAGGTFYKEAMPG